jgi:hypothetical protein
MYLCTLLYIEGTLGVSSHITTLKMGTEILAETSVSTCNQFKRLCAREDFIKFSRRESFNLWISNSLESIKCIQVHLNLERKWPARLFRHSSYEMSTFKVIYTLNFICNEG